jgi:hypothetical protein
MKINTGKIAWVNVSNALKDEAIKHSFATGEDDVVMEICEFFERNHAVEPSNELSTLIKDLQKKDIDYLHLF